MSVKLLNKVPRTYDPVAFERIVSGLLSQIADLEQKTKLKEAKSLLNESIGSLEEGRLYYRRDPNSVNLDLVLKQSGRLHRWSVNTSGSTGSSGGQAPADAPYVTTASDGDLTNEKVLAGTTNQITVTAGAGTATLSTPQNTHTAATPQFVRLGLGQAAHASKSINATNGAIFAENVDIDADSKAVTFGADQDATILYDGTNLVVNPKAVGSGKVSVQGGLLTSEAVEIDADSQALVLGADQDATVQYNGTDLLINPKAVGSGRLEVQGDAKFTGQVGFNNTNPPAASTGWSVTNVTPDKLFDADATSLDEIADTLGTLITFLLSRGDISA